MLGRYLSGTGKELLRGLPRWVSCKESACNAGDTIKIPGSGSSLEKESILAWEIPMTEEPGRLQSVGSQELDAT